MAGLNLRKAFNNDEQAIAAQEEIKAAIESSIVPPNPFEVGKTYLIRTVTMCNIGKVKSKIGNFLVLTDASWIADTGRFSECLKSAGKFTEVEPFLHDVFVATNNIIDATPWPYSLPQEAK